MNTNDRHICPKNASCQTERLPEAFREEMLPSTYQTGTPGEGPNHEQNRKYSFSINFSFSGVEQVTTYTIIFRCGFRGNEAEQSVNVNS